MHVMNIIVSLSISLSISFSTLKKIGYKFQYSFGKGRLYKRTDVSLFSLSVCPVTAVFLACPFLYVGDINNLISTGITILTCIVSVFWQGTNQSMQLQWKEYLSMNSGLGLFLFTMGIYHLKRVTKNFLLSWPTSMFYRINRCRITQATWKVCTISITEDISMAAL